jgi:hypothetical protein
MIRVHKAGVIIDVFDTNQNVLDEEHHIWLNGFQWAQLQTGRHPGGLLQEPTSHYMAPELSNSGQVTLSADVFGFGLILYQIAAKDRSVFNSVNGIDVARRWMRGMWPEFEEFILAATKEVIEKRWDEDPRARPISNARMGELRRVHFSNSAWSGRARSAIIHTVR